MAAAFGLSDSVVSARRRRTARRAWGATTGPPTLFLCLSEHEGFCIPLIEAMAFDLPVIAYRSTGVPYAMGGAGMLVDVKCYDSDRRADRSVGS